MTDQDFLNAAEQALNSIELCCDEINDTTQADIDNIRNGNALTLTFPNGTQIIVNLQKPIHEIWLAAPSGGYHFHLDKDGLWRENREGLELFSSLSRFASEQTQIILNFKPC